jgi:hypothetical protein
MLILDQQQTTVNATTGFLDDSAFDLAQTFTVGASGHLSGISVVIANAGPVTLSLLETVAGVPTFFVLASAVAIAPSLPGLTFFDFSSSDIHVHVGEVLAFSPSAVGSNGQVIGEDIGLAGIDPYSGGDEFYIDPGIGVTAWQPFATYPLSAFAALGVTHIDAAFETFVAVSEPDTLFIFGGALIALCILHPATLNAANRVIALRSNKGARIGTAFYPELFMAKMRPFLSRH